MSERPHTLGQLAAEVSEDEPLAGRGRRTVKEVRAVVPADNSCFDSSRCRWFVTTIIVIVFVGCLEVYMRGCVFDTPHSQVPRSPGLPQYSTGPQRSSSTSSRPLAAELPKPPPWKLRGTDPCVPVLGQEVVVGSREAFHYVPSALETAWTEQSRVGQICELAKKQTTDAGLWLNYSQAVFQPTPGVPSRDPGPEEAKVLSYFLMGEDKKPHWIEPLSGIARNPHSICMKSADLFDIRYLILESFCGRPGPKPIVRFFDLGCTSNAGTRDFLNVNYQQGSGAGPSIPLFFNMYKDRCLEFDHIYGWEAKSQSVSAWWEPLPDHIRERVRYYNVPVNENSCEETLGKDKYASKGSFLRMLPHAAKVEDFVVLKVDIDGGPELQIVESIARHPELSALVDEIFFEYHFYFDGIGFGWPPVTKERNVDTALDLMKRLRLAGIRSHFWI